MKLSLGAFIIFSCMMFSFAVNTNAQQKFHPLKNYSVTYELKGNTTGTKHVAAQDYGKKHCWIEVSEMNVMGNTTKKNEKGMTMIEGGDQWIITIDLDKNTGTKMKNPLYKGVAASMKGKDPKEYSKAMMEQMGGSKKGPKTVNGEECMEWTMMGGAFACITEDQIMVESGANMAGISISEVATEVKRNDPGPKGICDLGDATIKELDLGQMMGQ